MSAVSASETPSPAAIAGPSEGAHASAEPPRPLRVLVYSSDRLTRERIVLALGRKPAPELPAISITEVATEAFVMRTLDAGGIDLAILDGEAVPGGMGICRQLKDEIFQAPPVLVVVGRPDDAWLATWSRADAVVPQPMDPRVLAEEAAALLRRRLIGVDAS